MSQVLDGIPGALDYAVALNPQISDGYGTLRGAGHRGLERSVGASWLVRRAARPASGR